MSSGEKTLFEVAGERIESFRKAGISVKDSKYKYLMKLKQLAGQGVILSMSDREFLKSVEPDPLLPRCDSVSPTGKCLVGFSDEVGERCPHWGNWRESQVTCDGYDPEDTRTTRFGGWL
jgi:hypothetical protein